MEQHPRFTAQYKGEVIGWYDTREEAEAAVEGARQAEKSEAEDFRTWRETKDN